MELLEAVRGRRSVRTFRADKVSEVTIERILSAAIMAPSAGNRQAWEFIVIQKAETKEELARASWSQDFITSAPVLVAVCANLARSRRSYGERGANLYSIQESAAATQNLLLAAHSEGLGACWVGAFDEETVARLLGIPVDVRPVAIVPLGYPAEVPPPPPRLPLARVVHRERY